MICHKTKQNLDITGDGFIPCDVFLFLWKTYLSQLLQVTGNCCTMIVSCYMHYMDANKRLEKKLDGNYTRMLRAILNKSWQQHPTRHQLYSHLPPITKTIQVRRTRHAGHCCRSRDELIRDVLLWIPTHGRAKAGRPARTYIQQLCEDTGCCSEDLPRAMNDRKEWRERVRDIRTTSTIWWWWWWWWNKAFPHNVFSFRLVILPSLHTGCFSWVNSHVLIFFNSCWPTW